MCDCRDVSTTLVYMYNHPIAYSGAVGVRFRYVKICSTVGISSMI